MKTRIAAFCLCVLMLVTMCVPMSVSATYELSEDRSIVARSAIVVFLGTNAEQDMIMYEKNPDERLAPAGLTRIAVGLYALQTLEDQQMDPSVATGTYSSEVKKKVSSEGVRDLYTVGMKEGDVWHVSDLLTMSLIQTAADAVTTLVYTLAGSEEAFVQGMNEMLTTVGCTDTHFTNVYGLDDPQSYTTARDMYRLLRYASLNYSEMIAILGQSEHTVKPVTGEGSSWPTTNEMLRASSAYYYTPLVYGRSGFTESIGQSCASVARDAGFEYMTVVMGCRDEEDDSPAFTDTMTLFRWAYNTFSYKTVVSKNQPISRAEVKLAWSTDSVALVAGSDLEGMLREDTDVNSLTYEITLDEEYLTAPVEKGEVCGTAKIYDETYLIGEVAVCSAEYIACSQLLAVLNGIWKVISSPVMLIILGVFAALFIGYVVIGMAHNRSRRKKKHKRVKYHR